MSTLSRSTPHHDARGMRALVNAIVLKTIKDAAAPRPPDLCTPHEWYLAQLQVVEWIPEYGEKRSGAAYVKQQMEMQRELARGEDEMAIKQLEYRDFAELEKEVGELHSERVTLGEFLLAVGDTSIGDIESALIRQRAIDIRLTAVTAIMEAKRASIGQQAGPVAG